ncbi:MAG: hypothetical protein QM669_02410 [Siphonobacter sp.]
MQTSSRTVGTHFITNVHISIAKYESRVHKRAQAALISAQLNAAYTAHFLMAHFGYAIRNTGLYASFYIHTKQGFD